MTAPKGPLLVAVAFAVLAIVFIVLNPTQRYSALDVFENLIGKISVRAGEMNPDIEEELRARLRKLNDELPQSGDWRLNLVRARYHVLENDPVAALRHLDLAAAALPDLPVDRREKAALWEIPLLKAKILRRLGRYDEALPLLERAWSLNPQSRHIALGLSEAHFALAGEGAEAQARLSQAEHFANSAMKLSARDGGEVETSTFADAWNQRGVVRLRRNDLVAARSDFLEAVRLKPMYARAYYNLALCAALLSAEYAKPDDNKAASFRSEALRAAQELETLNPALHADLWNQAGFRGYVEGLVAD